MKEKIKKLFQGTKEDMIIACSLLVNNFDVPQFLREWIKENQDLHWEQSNDRVQVNFDKNNGWLDNDLFYYRIRDNYLLGCSVNRGICEAHEAYIPVEIINHS